tara:strand:- start:55 stop:237 length:183 start_codon:yes stop_codon:yes gene_type:complete
MKNSEAFVLTLLSVVVTGVLTYFVTKSTEEPVEYAEIALTNLFYISLLGVILTGGLYFAL